MATGAAINGMGGSGPGGELGVPEVLAQFSFFADLPEEIRAAMLSGGRLVHLDTGDIFYRAGETLTDFALVGRGVLRVARISDSGRAISLYHVQEGETCLVNVLCTLCDRPAPATAEVEERVTAVLYPGALLRDWIAGASVLRDYFFRKMSFRLIDVMTLVEEVAFARMDRRLADYLVQQFALVGTHTAARIKKTHHEMAEDLGTAREVVSRLLEEFQRAGAVRLGRGYVMLEDPTRLRILASSPNEP